MEHADRCETLLLGSGHGDKPPDWHSAGSGRPVVKGRGTSVETVPFGRWRRKLEDTPHLRCWSNAAQAPAHHEPHLRTWRGIQRPGLRNRGRQQSSVRPKRGRHGANDRTGESVPMELHGKRVLQTGVERGRLDAVCVLDQQRKSRRALEQPAGQGRQRRPQLACRQVSVGRRPANRCATHSGTRAGG